MDAYDDSPSLKPQYRLMGMLLEKQDLKDLMNNRWQQNIPGSQAWLARQLADLDEEIRRCHRLTLAFYEAEGLSTDELVGFLGDDLLDELPSASANSFAGRTPA